MNTSIFQSAVLFAFAGALALKLLELAELYHVPKANRPAYNEFVYWVPFIVLPIVGGGLAYAYVMSGVDLKPMLAVNVGVSAPLIIRAMAQLNPLQARKIDAGEGA